MKQKKTIRSVRTQLQNANELRAFFASNTSNGLTITSCFWIYNDTKSHCTGRVRRKKISTKIIEPHKSETAPQIRAEHMKWNIAVAFVVAAAAAHVSCVCTTSSLVEHWTGWARASHILFVYIFFLFASTFLCILFFLLLYYLHLPFCCNRFFRCVAFSRYFKRFARANILCIVCTTYVPLSSPLALI